MGWERICDRKRCKRIATRWMLDRDEVLWFCDQHYDHVVSYEGFRLETPGR